MSVLLLTISEWWKTLKSTKCLRVDPGSDVELLVRWADSAAKFQGKGHRGIVLQRIPNVVTNNQGVVILYWQTFHIPILKTRRAKSSGDYNQKCVCVCVCVGGGDPSASVLSMCTRLSICTISELDLIRACQRTWSFYFIFPAPQPVGPWIPMKITEASTKW